MLPPPRVMSAAETLRALVQRGDVRLPVMPSVMVRLLALLEDVDRADARSVAAIVRTEPALAELTLRLANSIAYGGQRPVLELHEAVGRIGLRQVGGLASTVALRGLFHSSHPERAARLERMGQRSLVTAVFASIVPFGTVDAELAYLAGLLHDLGQPLVLKLLEAVEGKRIEPVPDAEVEALIGTLHVELGHRLLVSWRIPDVVCEAVRRHHDANVSDRDALLVRLQAADAFAEREPDQPSSWEHPALRRLALSDADAARLTREVEDRVTLLRCFL